MDRVISGSTEEYVRDFVENWPPNELGEVIEEVPDRINTRAFTVCDEVDGLLIQVAILKDGFPTQEGIIVVEPDGQGGGELLLHSFSDEGRLFSVESLDDESAPRALRDFMDELRSDPGSARDLLQIPVG